MGNFIQTLRGTVYPWQCDHMGHINVTWYTAKFDEATWSLYAEMGVMPSQMRKRDWGVAAVQQNISYKRELLPGDVIVIRSGVLEAREKVVRFLHELVNVETGELAATAEVTAVCMDFGKRKSRSFPPDVFECLRGMVVEPAAQGHSG